MTQGAEAFVQVPLDGAGKKIRNLQMQVVQSDGTIATVLMQVVTIVDENGFPIDLNHNETNMLLRSVLKELTALRRIQGRATGLGFIGLEGEINDLADIGG